MKAATVGNYKVRNKPLISIHAAREGGDDSLHLLGNDIPISIHAAREGGDFVICHCVTCRCISIHAAREGGDDMINPIIHSITNFNPRRP